MFPQIDPIDGKPLDQQAQQLHDELKQLALQVRTLAKQGKIQLNHSLIIGDKLFLWNTMGEYFVVSEEGIGRTYYPEVPGSILYAVNRKSIDSMILTLKSWINAKLRWKIIKSIDDLSILDSTDDIAVVIFVTRIDSATMVYYRDENIESRIRPLLAPLDPKWGAEYSHFNGARVEISVEEVAAFLLSLTEMEKVK